MRIGMDKVVDGVKRYLAKEIYPGMTDWQEMIANVAVNQALKNVGSGLGVVSATGLVSADEILDDLKNEIAKKGKLEVPIPLFGKMSFVPADVDKLKAEIYGGVIDDSFNQTNL